MVKFWSFPNYFKIFCSHVTEEILVGAIWMVGWVRSRDRDWKFGRRDLLLICGFEMVYEDFICKIGRELRVRD
jgi:hypothetical protein